MTTPETQQELIELLRTMRAALDRVLELVIGEKGDDDDE